MKWDDLSDSPASEDLKTWLSWMEQHTNVDDKTIEMYHPMLLSAQANAADNPTWEQVVNEPYSEGYWEAMEKEVTTLQKEKDCWEIVDKEDFMNVLPSTWAVCCKRYPNGKVRKFKARFCARGDKQIEDIDFFDTFASVTNWTTIRILLIMLLVLGLSTK